VQVRGEPDGVGPGVGDEPDALVPGSTGDLDGPFDAGHECGIAVEELVQFVGAATEFPAGDGDGGVSQAGVPGVVVAW
jgi:hypothetical protein